MVLGEDNPPSVGCSGTFQEVDVGFLYCTEIKEMRVTR
jgi:hypothetical protein